MGYDERQDGPHATPETPTAAELEVPQTILEATDSSTGTQDGSAREEQEPTSEIPDISNTPTNTMNAGLSNNYQARLDWESKRRGQQGPAPAIGAIPVRSVPVTTMSSRSVVSTQSSLSSATRSKHGLSRHPPPQTQRKDEVDTKVSPISKDDADTKVPPPSSSIKASPAAMTMPAPILSTIPSDFMPQEMPTTPNNTTTCRQSPPRPGAYRLDQHTTANTAQRNPSLLLEDPRRDSRDASIQIGPGSSHQRLMDPQSGMLIEATLVVEDAEANLHSPQHVVVEAEQLHCGFSKVQLGSISVCLVIVLVAIVAGVFVTQMDKDNSDSTPTASPRLSTTSTLQQIQERGVLHCGIWDEPHRLIQVVQVMEKEEDQIDFALCRAIAAAVLGDETKYEPIDVAQEDNFQALELGTIDVLASHVETSMQADVYEDEHDVNVGFTFSVPYLYMELVFGGLPEYVACADDDFNTAGNCSDLTFCLNKDSEYIDLIREILPEKHIVEKDHMGQILAGYIKGDCNVIPSENSGVMEFGMELLYPDNPRTHQYYRGQKAFTKDVATMATRDDDPEWSDYINAILIGLFAAEQANITKSNAAEMAKAAVLGEELVRAVEAVGNYGDVLAVGVETITDRGYWSRFNNGTTGLLYTLPFGKVNRYGPGPIPGGTLESVAAGELNCGLRLDRPGFAIYNSDTDSYHGLDVDYCRAVGSAIFKFDLERINFVAVQDDADGYQKLQAGEVDLLAGFTWTVQNDFREKTTGEGYSFSHPYYYRPIDRQNYNGSFVFDENLCLVTRQDDPQFSSFVYWIVQATFYAEYSIERGFNDESPITQADPSGMPNVRLFGDAYTKMLRNAILAVGNYQEMYERNVAEFLPRGGRNTLNSVEQRGPQIYVPPGFFVD